MSQASIAETLRELGFLQGIADEYLAQIAIVTERLSLPENKLVFREGEAAADVFLVLGGSVSLEICAPGVGCRRILTVGPGELLGWSPLLGQMRFTATARTLTPTELLKIHAGQLMTICEHNPRFGYEFMRRAAQALAKRLNATRMQLLDVYGQAMPTSDEAGK